MASWTPWDASSTASLPDRAPIKHTLGKAGPPCRVWRLTTARCVGTAFTGDGARRYGGRWNPKGISVVYTAGSLSLAMLEMLVQDQPLRARYVAIAADLPDDLALETITADQLPDDWRDASAREALRALGTDWARRQETAVLAVPSAIIPIESNYLLNPAHADFGRMKAGAPELLETDLRLAREGEGDCWTYGMPACHFLRREPRHAPPERLPARVGAGAPAMR